MVSRSFVFTSSRYGRWLDAPPVRVFPARGRTSKKQDRFAIRGKPRREGAGVPAQCREFPHLFVVESYTVRAFFASSRGSCDSTRNVFPSLQQSRTRLVAQRLSLTGLGVEKHGLE